MRYVVFCKAFADPCAALSYRDSLCRQIFDGCISSGICVKGRRCGHVYQVMVFAPAEHAAQVRDMADFAFFESTLGFAAGDDVLASASVLPAPVMDASPGTGWLSFLGYLLPRRHREVLMGDIHEDVLKLRAAGRHRIILIIFASYQFILALLIQWPAIAGLALWGWLLNLLRKWWAQ